MNNKITLSSAWAWFCAKAYAVANPIVDNLANLEPLPAWTNKYFAMLCVAIWILVIGLNQL